jgi:Ca2+/Na+ antiporter
MSLQVLASEESAGGNRSLGKIAGGLLVAAVLVIGAAVLWQSDAQDSSIATNEVIVVVLYVALALFLVGFLLVFTGRLNEAKVSYMVVYCYLFTWFFLIAPPLVFIGFPETLDSARKVRDSPVGIVLGCAERPVAQQIDAERRSVPRDAAWLPKEIACGNNTPQWLLNIGGTVMPRGEIEGHRAAHFKDIVFQNGSRGLKDRENRGAVQPVAQGPVPYDVQMWEGLLAMPPGETLKQTDRVLGGVVVPLYFVIIALMGGLVSMMRRVPEYQRRIAPGCPERITCEQAREYLVFQIMQVLSAPLIAITAYYAFEPTSRATSIALAFITGFSSELILLYVRAITVRLRPEESTSPAKRPDNAVGGNSPA